MSEFMKPEILPKQTGYEIDTSHGIVFLPSSVCGRWDAVEYAGKTYFAEYMEPGAEIQSIEEVTGYFGRYSAPGYLDCTDWTFSKNRRSLEKELRETYGPQD